MNTHTQTLRLPSFSPLRNPSPVSCTAVLKLFCPGLKLWRGSTCPLPPNRTSAASRWISWLCFTTGQSCKRHLREFFPGVQEELICLTWFWQRLERWLPVCSGNLPWDSRLGWTWAFLGDTPPMNTCPIQGCDSAVL